MDARGGAPHLSKAVRRCKHGSFCLLCLLALYLHCAVMGHDVDG